MTGRNPLTLNLVDRPGVSPDLVDNTSTSWDEWEAFRKASGSDAALFGDPLERERPKRLRWLALSLVGQGLVLGFWMLHSVTTETALPPPRVVRTFLTAPPVAPPPPPPAGIGTVSPSAPVAQSPAQSPAKLSPPTLLAALTPTIMPMELGSETGFGLDEGVESDVPGGVVGGILGGLAAPLPPPPAPEGTEVYLVTGELERPDKLVHVDPVYPPVAAVARVEGVVILEAVIDGEGHIEDLRILRSVPLLDEAAIDAVKLWEYEPTIIAGKSVAVQMTVTVRFALG